jgi:hypothetical protein
VLPALSAEVGLLLDKQSGQEQMVAMGSGAKINSVAPTGYGVRAGFDLIDFKVCAIQLNGTYHNKTTGDLVASGIKFGELDNQYLAAGAMVNFKFLVDFGAGLEYRQESLTWRPTGTPATITAGDSTLGRTWARVNVGFHIPLPVVTPFFLLEVAAPLSKNNSTTTAKDLAESLAPQAQVGLYGGIRF